MLPGTTTVKGGFRGCGIGSAASEARVAAIESVVDFVGVGRHGERSVIGHRAAVLIKDRSDDVRIHAGGLEAADHGLSKAGEVIVNEVGLVGFPGGWFAEDISPTSSL